MGAQNTTVSKSSDGNKPAGLCLPRRKRPQKRQTAGGYAKSAAALSPVGRKAQPARRLPGSVQTSAASTPTVGETTTYEMRPFQPIMRATDRACWLSYQLVKGSIGAAGSCSFDEANNKLSVTWSAPGTHTIRFFYKGSGDTKRSLFAELKVTVITTWDLKQKVAGAVKQAKGPIELQPLIGDMGQRQLTGIARQAQTEIDSMAWLKPRVEAQITAARDPGDLMSLLSYLEAKAAADPKGPMTGLAKRVSDRILELSMAKRKGSSSLDVMLLRLKVARLLTKSSYHKDRLQKAITAMEKKAGLLAVEPRCRPDGKKHGSRTTLKAAMLNPTTGKIIPMQLFAGLGKDGQWVLVDATNPGAPAHHRGATMDAAVATFRGNNKYPTTASIRIEPPAGTHLKAANRHFKGRGGTTWDAIAKALGYIAMAATAAALILSTGGMATIPLVVATVAGAGATYANYRAQSSRGTYTTQQRNLDIIATAGDVLSLGMLGKLGKIATYAPRMRRAERAYVLATGLAGGAELVTMNYPYVRALTLIISDAHLSADQKKGLIAQTLQQALRANAVRLVMKGGRAVVGRMSKRLRNADGTINIDASNATRVIGDIAQVAGVKLPKGVKVTFDATSRGEFRPNPGGKPGGTIHIGPRSRYATVLEEVVHAAQRKAGGTWYTKQQIGTLTKTGTTGQKRRMASDIERVEIEAKQRMLGLPVGANARLPSDSVMKATALKKTRLSAGEIDGLIRDLRRSRANYKAAKTGKPFTVPTGYHASFKNVPLGADPGFQPITRNRTDYLTDQLGRRPTQHANTGVNVGLAPQNLRYSQTSVSRRYGTGSPLGAGLDRLNKQGYSKTGDRLIVVMMPDGQLSSFENRRVRVGRASTGHPDGVFQKAQRGELPCTLHGHTDRAGAAAGRVEPRLRSHLEAGNTMSYPDPTNANVTRTITLQDLHTGRWKKTLTWYDLIQIRMRTGDIAPPTSASAGQRHGYHTTTVN